MVSSTYFDGIPSEMWILRRVFVCEVQRLCKKSVGASINKHQWQGCLLAFLTRGSTHRYSIAWTKIIWTSSLSFTVSWVWQYYRRKRHSCVNVTENQVSHVNWGHWKLCQILAVVAWCVRAVIKGRACRLHPAKPRGRLCRYGARCIYLPGDFKLFSSTSKENRSMSYDECDSLNNVMLARID